MYYQKTITAIRQRIEKEKPGTRPRFREFLDSGPAPLSYLLWMCFQIEVMDTSSDESALKAGRWIGWILAHIEIHGLWDNTKSRRLVRSDHKKGFDKPHQK